MHIVLKLALYDTLWLILSLEKQTVAFNIRARTEFNTKKRARMGVWEAMELLNTLVDESDPDVSHRPISTETPR